MIKRKSDAKLELSNLAGINIFNNIKYIDISIHISGAGNAPDAKLELHLLDERGLSGHLGLIPGWGALPALYSLQNKLNLQRLK